VDRGRIAATYQPVVPTEEEREAIQARIDNGEVSLDTSVIRYPSAYPGDPILRNEFRRAVLAIAGYRTAPDYLDAGDPQAVLADVSFYVGKYRHSGAPAPDLIVECECDCTCRFLGRFDEVTWSDGLLRCRACTAEGHPPRLRGHQ
jgi:hypothetical protein